MKSLTLCLSFVALVMVRPAAAEDDVSHVVAITLSPVHLILPFGEVTAEFRVQDKVGIAGIVGFGQLSGTVTSGTSSEDIKATLFDVGASGRWYAIGDFDHGMQLGFEALYVYVSADFNSQGVTGVGNGLALSPFIGYKISADVGFTFEAEVGGSYLVSFAEAADTAGNSATASSSQFGLMLNLNIGWAF